MPKLGDAEMIKKHYYSWDDVEHMCQQIALQMYKDAWRPDYIVGITRGGNVPATILSNMLGVRCETLKVKLRDNDPGESCETNCWMADDAFGYVEFELLVV
jgi:hypoxanthine phosphoribosyltransferase